MLLLMQSKPNRYGFNNIWTVTKIQEYDDDDIMFVIWFAFITRYYKKDV